MMQNNNEPENEHPKIILEDDFVDVSVDFNIDCGYTPRQLNTIIFNAYHMQYEFKESSSSDNPNMMLHIFYKKNQTQKIVLFNTVKDLDSKDTSYLSTLSEALQYYIDVIKYNATDILIIPVVELNRKHFRLLKIANEAIYYYDSKNSFISKSLEVIMAIIPAAREAIGDTILKLQEEMEEKEQKSPGAAQILSTIGTFMFRTAEIYPNYYDNVRKTCHPYFPALPFYDSPLANQDFNENTDCGPFTAAYAVLAVNGHPKVTDNILTIRALHGDSKSFAHATGDLDYRGPPK